MDWTLTSDGRLKVSIKTGDQVRLSRKSETYQGAPASIETQISPRLLKMVAKAATMAILLEGVVRRLYDVG